MKTWKTFIVPIILVLTAVSTACTPPAATTASSTPTIVRLSEAELAEASAQPSLGTEAATAAPAADVAPSAQPPLGTATATPAPSATSATATEAPTASAVPAAKVQAEVVADELNEREGPGVDYAVVGTVTKGAVLEVTGVTADGSWLRVTTAGGGSGWVSGKEAYTRIVGSLLDVPVLSGDYALVETASGSGSTLAVTQVSYATGGQSATTAAKAPPQDGCDEGDGGRQAGLRHQERRRPVRRQRRRHRAAQAGQRGHRPGRLAGWNASRLYPLGWGRDGHAVRHQRGRQRRAGRLGRNPPGQVADMVAGRPVHRRVVPAWRRARSRRKSAGHMTATITPTCRRTSGSPKWTGIATAA